MKAIHRYLDASSAALIVLALVAAIFAGCGTTPEQENETKRGIDNVVIDSNRQDSANDNVRSTGTGAEV